MISPAKIDDELTRNNGDLMGFVYIYILYAYIHGDLYSTTMARITAWPSDSFQLQNRDLENRPKHKASHSGIL